MLQKESGMMDISLPNAIVIAEDHYNGLGVIRSLGERNIPIILVLLSKEINTVIDKSRYVKKVYKIRRSAEDLLEIMKKIISDGQRYAVFPLSDFSATIIDSHRNKLTGCVIPHANGKMTIVMNKLVQSELFKNNGVLVPHHIEAHLKNTDAAQWNDFPAIIKPLASVEGQKTDIVTVNNSTELEGAIKVLKDKGYTRVLIEDFITGPSEFMIEIMGYVNSQGEPVFSKVIHKVREYPISNGSTAYAYLEDDANYINFDALTASVKSTGYYGVFDIEYKYANGEAYFIEMNFRNGAPAYALTKYGFNIVYEWLCDSCGIECKPVHVTENKYFMCEHRDVFNMMKGHVALLVWIKEFRKAEKIIWDWKDLKPSRLLYRNVLRTTIRRLLHGKQ